MVNTLPGLLLESATGAAELGAGAGGISGSALLPVGLRAVKRARSETHIPLLGVGGVMAPEDAVAYARAGAALIQLGTASFATPRAGLLLTQRLEKWGRRHRVSSWEDLVCSDEDEGSGS